MTEQGTKKKKHYETGNRLASVMIVVLIVTAICMAVLVYRGMNEQKHWIGTDSYDVILRKPPTSAFSLYYDDYGPFRAEGGREKELFSYARYLHASLLYYAHEDAGDAERAARMRTIMEENAPDISDALLNKITSLGDFTGR